MTAQSPSAWPGEPAVSESLAKEFGVTADEWARLVARVGRTPTYTELGVTSVMWSEHCSYKSSRVHLRRLPTTGPKVVQGPGENAGAVDIGDGWCAVFKMESHNHPSFIAPYQGSATGVGGILRDVFTMGARPIASLNSLRFGRADHPRTPELVRGVVSGIGGYGNCMGVPTVGGEVQFDASYDGNILVNAFTVGIAETKKLFFGKASGVGNPVLYVGARTGRDGIHGATMASAEFDADSDKKLPTVQVGDPFMEKLLLEACLEIFASGCLEGVQDMGAAGLTSSSVEMAARAGNGIELDLDAIPRRTTALTPYEMLLSESQERMLMVAKPGREGDVFRICEKWGLDAAVVGRVTDTQRFVCKATPGYDPLAWSPNERAPVVAVDLPIDLLTDDAPKYERPMREPAAQVALPKTPVTFASPAAAKDALLAFLGSPNLGSRAWIYRQYDSIVGDGTVVGPGQGDAAVVRVFCGAAGEKFLVLSVDCNGRQVELDAFAGAAMAVAECARNIVCTGGRPLGLTDCLNFGSPEKPETMWRIAKAIDGVAAACTALGVPVVSGNVSLYNETDGSPILPTPTVAIVGEMTDLTTRLGVAFRAAGDSIAVLGAPSRGHLDGSEWQVQRDGKPRGASAGIDLALEVRLQEAILEMAAARVLESAHDVSDGGLFATLAESCMAGRLGADVSSGGFGEDFAPFLGEEPSRVVVSVGAQNIERAQAIAAKHSVPWKTVGRVGGTALRLTPAVAIEVAALAASHTRALAPIVGAD